MYRRSSGLTGRTRKLVMGVATAALAVGAFAVSAGQANAAVPEHGNSDISESRVLVCPMRGCI